ncbi:46 kDa FK506-binding nuclear protein-like [Orbicella faveolata]|uniref:46 kDa FK506-binding nuclear protein-like n=1 Tax=Orbicella faveolata TaxID=48498 RepID=UPI0009E51A11|nr:46 kDa FK506-binding nuclear protein-like [Orbicella faveolata]
MFWGVTLDSGKRYTQTVEKSFHLSMAALGFQNCSSTPVTVMVEVDKAQFALCTLQPGKIPQQPLDYCFTEGEEITFFTEGPGDVHLTGYLMDEPNTLEFENDEDELTADTDESESASVSNSDSDDDESSSDEITLGDLLQSGDITNDDNDDEDNEDEESGDDDWDPSKDNPKRRKQTKKEKKKKKKSKTEDSDEHDDVITSKDFEQTEGTTQNEDGDDDYDPEKQIKSDTKKETKRNKKKRKKLETEQPTVENGLTQPQNLKKKAKRTQLKSPDNDSGVVNTESANSLQNNKESEKVNSTPVNSLNSVKTNSSKKNEGKTQNQVDLQETSPEKRNNQSQVNETKKRKLPGGTVLEDITKGTGPVAKKGQKVYVYYKGHLAKTKKQFDACLNGPPFSFRLGVGEVIRGWDLGVAGMQVGGKRKLTVPPSQGYGNKKMGPIPPNSTLEFDIQLIRLQ